MAIPKMTPAQEALINAQDEVRRTHNAILATIKQMRVELDYAEQQVNAGNRETDTTGIAALDVLLAKRATQLTALELLNTLLGSGR